MIFLIGLLNLLLVSCSHLGLQKKDTEKAKLYLQMGVNHLKENAYSKALESTNEALKYDPEYAAAYNHLALIYMETKRYAKSEEAFSRALKLEPNYPEVLNNMGVLFSRQEKFEKAMAYFQQALDHEKYPTPENALTNLGHAQFRMGDYTKAKYYHQKALDILPEFCLANKNMGDIYAKERKFSKAADYFQRAITHCPLYQESQYKLGLSLMKSGQKKTARLELRKLIDTHKTGPYVDRSNEVLKFLP